MSAVLVQLIVTSYSARSILTTWCSRRNVIIVVVLQVAVGASYVK